MAKTRFSIEEAFDELDRILMRMEEPELGLSDSIALYKKGVKLLEKCSQTLDKTEKEIQILQEGQYAESIEGQAFGENQGG